MKKTFVSVFVATLVASNVFAKGDDPIIVESGSLAFIKNGGTATVVYDYSNLKVEGLPLDDFLASKDEKFYNDWESDIVPTAENGFAAFVSTMNKNFSAQVGSEMSADYKIVLHLNELGLGNVSANFNPFGGVKGGGAKISGIVDFIDNKTGEKICVLKFNNIKGVNAYSDRDRWTLAYRALSKGLGKLAKKK